MKLKDLKKIITEEILSLEESKFLFTEGPCGGTCSHNGVVCCQTACDISDCHCCCFEHSPLCHSTTDGGGNKHPKAMGGAGMQFSSEEDNVTSNQKFRQRRGKGNVNPSQMPPRRR